MTTYIEDNIKDILNENDIQATDICIVFKRKYAYVTFYYREGTSSKANKIEKQKLKDFLRNKEGSAHSQMRKSAFFDLCE